MSTTSRLCLTQAKLFLQRGFATWQVPSQWQPHTLSGFRSVAAILPSTSRRTLSSAAAVEKETEIVLYEKIPGQVGLLRSGFGFSCFHSIYWIWYAVDFVPTVNAAQMSELHVDPMISTVGILFASIVQAIFTGYPLRLVSKLGWRPASREFTVYTHSLPLLQPSTAPRVNIVGDLRLDPASVEARRITALGQLQYFKGLLPIGKPNQWPPYIVDIRQAIEVKQPEILLELLLQPERIDQDSSKADATQFRPNRRSGVRRKKGGRKRR